MLTTQAYKSPEAISVSAAARAALASLSWASRLFRVFHGILHALEFVARLLGFFPGGIEGVKLMVDQAAESEGFEMKGPERDDDANGNQAHQHQVLAFFLGKFFEAVQVHRVFSGKRHSRAKRTQALPVLGETWGADRFLRLTPLVLSSICFR